MSIRLRTAIRNGILGMVLLVFAFLMIPAVSSYAQDTSNPTNYWKLDESFGSTFIDSKGVVNASCSFPNCPATSTGKINNALLFDGINDAVDVPPYASFNWGNTDSFSIEFWVKTDTGSTCAGDQVIVGRDDGSTNLHWWVGCKDGGQAAFYLFDKSGVGVGIAGTKALTNGFWHHITAVRDAGTGEIRLYVDGANEVSHLIDFAGGFDSSGAALNIGWLNLGGGYHFQGVVDEVALYNRALSEKELRSHYYLSRGYSEMCTAPIAIMPLGDSITDGSGSSSMPGTDYRVGYRQNLYLDLVNGGYDVNFVGSESSGGLALPAFDFNHEGHGGWCAQGCPLPYFDIVDHAFNFLVDNPAEVVLLHIGTNDIGLNVQDPNVIMSILDEIKRYSENTTVLLARIINRTDGKDVQTTQFNDSVEALALQRIEQGDKIIIVDQEQALNYVDDMADSLHPNLAGYNKMADAWLLSLNGVLPACVITTTTINAPSVTYNAAGVVTVTVSSTLVAPTGNVSLTVDGSAALTQTLNTVSGSVPPSSSATFTITGLRAGTHTLNASFASQGSFAASAVNGTLTVFTKNLIVTTTASNKVYDGTTTATVVYVDNRVPGDSLTLTGTAAFADKNVAIGKTVTVTGISINGSDAGNYTLAATTATTTADITTRPLAITATAANKTYDGTTTVSVTYGDNRLSGDVLTVNGVASFSDKNVGTSKAVTITNITITGIDSGNYALMATTASTTADIIAPPDGDLDGSGVSVTDALRALNIAGGLINPTAADISHGDVAPLVNGIPQPDGSIDIGDVVVILRKTVGLVNW